MVKTNSKKIKPSSLILNKKDNLELLKNMLLIRRFEEKAGQLYGMGSIGGFCHLYIGQEAVVVGMQKISNNNDTVITSYRDHGHMLACGMDPKGVMSELTGRKDGFSSGKGGSMHMFSREKNFFGGHGIVAAQVPIGVGLAFSHKYNSDNGICMTYFGDGAVNQGQVYESFNMAALWNLPVVFIIENNKYGMGTSVERASAGKELYERGLAYGIPGIEIDGMDVHEVINHGNKVVEYCRSGKGPYIIEMKTYRYRGHSMSDPAKYRTRNEVNEIKQHHDPIDNLKEDLIKKGYEEKDFNLIDKEIKLLVSNATDFALESPLPDNKELYTNVYVE